MDIIDIELRGLISRAEALGYTVTLTDAAKSFLADKSYDAQYGLDHCVAQSKSS